MSLPASRFVVVQVNVSEPAPASVLKGGTVPSWGTSVDSLQTRLTVVLVLLVKVTVDPAAGAVPATPVTTAVKTSD